MKVGSRGAAVVGSKERTERSFGPKARVRGQREELNILGRLPNKQEGSRHVFKEAGASVPHAPKDLQLIQRLLEVRGGFFWCFSR